MTSEQRETSVRYMNKARGWFMVAGGGVLLACAETWTLIKLLGAPQWSFWVLALGMLGVDPQLDSKTAPGIPPGYSLARFCCEVIEACAPQIAAIKPQLAFFEARGLGL